MKSIEKAFLLSQLCDVATCANPYAGDYKKELKGFYSSFVTDNGPQPISKDGTRSALDSASPESGRLLMDLANQKLRLEGLH